MYCVGDKVNILERVHDFGYDFNENEVFTVTEVIGNDIRINAQFLDHKTIGILKNETSKGLTINSKHIKPAIVRESIDLML